MRQTMPDAEKRLWGKLRNRQLGGLKFRRQHTIGPFVADFACVEAMLVVEADGGQHDAGREADARRTRYLEKAGWRVLRFWNVEVLKNTDGVLRTILNATTTPLPSFTGEGGARSLLGEWEGEGTTTEEPSPRPSPAKAGEGAGHS